MMPDRDTCYWDDMPGYHVDVVLQDDGLYYWHCFCGSERINGGLSEHRYWAIRDAELAAYRDLMQRRPVGNVLPRYRWPHDLDGEYESWEQGRGA